MLVQLNAHLDFEDQGTIYASLFLACFFCSVTLRICVAWALE